MHWLLSLETNRKKIKQFIKYLGLTIWLALPIYLFFLPANHFDRGQSICPSKVFFDFECFGCGLTRAVQHALHFEYAEAFEFNKLILVVFPILIMFYLHILGRLLSLNIFSFLKKLY